MTKRAIIRKIVLPVVACLLTVTLMGCGEDGLGNNHDEERGRGDAGISFVDDCDRSVYQAPDRFANVAVMYVYENPSDDTTGDCSAGTGACNGMYQTTRKDGTLQMSVVPNDPTCPGATS